jgi:hypothetical protein
VRRRRRTLRALGLLLAAESLRREVLKSGVAKQSTFFPHRDDRRVPLAGSILGLLLACLAWCTQTFIGFNEGRIRIETAGGGWPSTTNFDLSSRNVAAHAATDTQGGGYGVITGTAYTTKTQSTPTPTGLGSIAFSALSWANGSATDWTAPKSIVARDNSGTKLLGAWDINGGSTVDMSVANTTLNVTPTYLPTQMV